MIDARVLYPSLRIREAVAICGEAVWDSTVKFQNIDYRTGSIFIAIEMMEDEIVAAGLRGVFPTRLTKRGRKTTIANDEISGD